MFFEPGILPIWAKNWTKIGLNDQIILKSLESQMRPFFHMVLGTEGKSHMKFKKWSFEGEIGWFGPNFWPKNGKIFLHYSKVLCEIDTKAWKNGLFWLFLPLCMNLDIWANIGLFLAQVSPNSILQRQIFNILCNIQTQYPK